MAKRNRSLLLWTTLIILCAAVAAFFLLPSRHTQQTSAPLVGPTHAIPATEHPTIGAANAPVKITVFEDLKCENCRRYNLSIFPMIKSEFIDTGKAQYTVILLSFLHNSAPAGNAALCVWHQNPKAFIPYIDALFEHQPPENVDWATIPNLQRWASDLEGINQQDLIQCMMKKTYVPQLHKNLQYAKKIMDGQVATPSIYINGRRLTSFDPKQIRETIETAISNSQQDTAQ